MQLGAALVHVHSLGVTHRDVKPENLLLRSADDEATLVLCDFGLAFQVLPGASECFRALPGASGCFRVLPSASDSVWARLLSRAGHFSRALRHRALLSARGSRRRDIRPEGVLAWSAYDWSPPMAIRPPSVGAPSIRAPPSCY